VTRKTKIVCTIGPSTNTKEMIWKLAEAGMNVARLNMSHGDHASHQKVIDLVKEYNAQSKDNVVAIMLDTKVLSYAFTCLCLHLSVLLIMLFIILVRWDNKDQQRKKGENEEEIAKAFPTYLTSKNCILIGSLPDYRKRVTISGT
jgi:Pyruvate kinase, barrel domain